MARKTKEELEAEKQAAAEQKQREEASAAEKEAQEKLAATTAAAKAAGAVAIEKLPENQSERQSAISVGNDPETGEPYEEDSKEFGGQLISGDNYTVVTREHLGRSTVEIIPAGWVGEAPSFAAHKLPEIIDLLGQVKNLPKA